MPSHARNDDSLNTHSDLKPERQTDRQSYEVKCSVFQKLTSFFMEYVESKSFYKVDLLLDSHSSTFLDVSQFPYTAHCFL